MQLDFVTPRRRQAIVQFEQDTHAMQNGVAVDKRYDIPDDAREVEPHERNFFFFRECPHPMDNLTRPSVILDDVLKNVEHFLKVGRFGSKEPLGRLSIAEDGSERLI